MKGVLGVFEWREGACGGSDEEREKQRWRQAVD